MPSPIKVLIVEDSIVARELLKGIIESDPELEVVSAVSSGEEALRIVSREAPDVISMDINLPGMSGYEATDRILQKLAVPIVIITSIDDFKGKEASFGALDCGALSILTKPVGPGNPDFERQAASIRKTLKVMAGVKVVKRRFATGSVHSISQKVFPDRDSHIPTQIVGIGASTGGPPVLANILGRLPENYHIPIVIMQHTLPGFEEPLARHLNDLVEMEVVLAENGMSLEPGRAIVIPCDTRVTFPENKRIALQPIQSSEKLTESVDMLFEALLASFGEETTALLLSGMGRDGAEGLHKLRKKGALTLVQSEHTCAVYGMPKAAKDLGAATRQLDPEALSLELANLIK